MMAKASATVRLRGRLAGYRKRNLHSQWLRKRIKEQKNKCAICGGIMAPKGQPSAIGLEPSLDHIRPISKGGIDHWENTQATHVACNNRKGSSYVE